MEVESAALVAVDAALAQGVARAIELHRPAVAIAEHVAVGVLLTAGMKAPRVLRLGRKVDRAVAHWIFESLPTNEFRRPRTGLSSSPAVDSRHSVAIAGSHHDLTRRALIFLWGRETVRLQFNREGGAMPSKKRVETRHIGAATLSLIAAPLLLVMSACGSGLQGGGTSTSDSDALTTTSKPPAQYRYQIVDVPGATATSINAINDWGATVGTYRDAAGAQHAFIRGPSGKVTTVDIPGAGGITLRGINDVGVAVGFYSVETPQGPNALAFHGFKRTPNGVITVVDLPGAGDSALLGINNIGNIVGQYDLEDQSVGGSFVLKHGRFTTLQDPPGAAPFNVFATGINDLGVISGSFLGLDGNTHAFLLRGGTYTTFDDPGATVTDLPGLNDRGQAVGVSDVSGGFVFNTVTLSISTSIACPGGTDTAFPRGINNRGQVAGTCQLSAAPGPNHGFIATPVDDD